MRKNILSLVVLCLLLLVMSAMTFYAYFDDAALSKSENRTLAGFPSLSVEGWFSGDYAAGMNSFLSDHIFLREYLVKYAGNFESSLQYKMYVLYDGRKPSQRQDIGSDVLILPDRILLLYIRDRRAIREYVGALESVFETVPDRINKYFFMAPTRIEFEGGSYRKYSDSQKDDIQMIYTLLPDNVQKIDVYGALAGKDINKVFYRTDHHWTQLGTYHAANAILSAVKKDAVDIGKFQEKRGEHYLGYLSIKHRVKGLEAYPDELIYYTDGAIPDETVYYPEQNGFSRVKPGKLIDPSRTCYYTFVAPEFEYAVIEGKNKQGGCLLLVADSFGYALVTWLAEKYNQIVLIEPIYYKGGKTGLLQLLSKYSVTDFMIGQCVMSVIPYFTQEISRLSEVSAKR
jgi:hypothetical protein